MPWPHALPHAQLQLTRAYYCAEAALAIESSFVLGYAALRLGARRQAMMIVHHSVTLVLIVASWRLGIPETGAVVMWLHSASDIFITTKIPCGTYNAAKANIQSNLKQLAMARVDLMLIHFNSCWGRGSLAETWRALEDAKSEGKVKAIGVSHFTKKDLDRLKKAPGYTTLRQLFVSRYGPADSDGFKKAQAEFSRSLAGYSILMWLLLLRDRHNANLMLDDDGHYFHIDFGFCLGHSTGKQIGGLVECSAFKLTQEYIELLGGKDSAGYVRQSARTHTTDVCSTWASTTCGRR